MQDPLMSEQDKGKSLCRVLTIWQYTPTTTTTQYLHSEFWAMCVPGAWSKELLNNEETGSAYSVGNFTEMQ